MAMEDAVILARCLVEHEGVAALREYESRRIDRTATITKLSDNAGALAAWQRPLAVRARAILMKSAGGLMARRISRLVSFHF